MFPSEILPDVRTLDIASNVRLYRDKTMNSTWLEDSCLLYPTVTLATPSHGSMHYDAFSTVPCYLVLDSFQLVCVTLIMFI